MRDSLVDFGGLAKVVKELILLNEGGGLSKAERMVIRERFFEGMTYVKIAAVHNCTRAVVKRFERSGLKKLNQIFGADVRPLLRKT